MALSQTNSSPCAVFASSPLSSSSGYDRDYSSTVPQRRTTAPAASSPLACRPPTSSTSSNSTNNLRTSSARRRLQYKSRSASSPSGGSTNLRIAASTSSSSPSSAASSSSASIWHNSLVEQCANRVKQDRQRRTASHRPGLVLAEQQHQGGDLTEEEQLIVRRLWRKEVDRRRALLEEDYDNQLLGVSAAGEDVDEADALGWDSCVSHDDEVALQDILEDFLHREQGGPASLTTTDGAMMDLDQAPDAGPSSLPELLLASTCPSCHQSELASEQEHIGCHHCQWSIPCANLVAAQQDASQHLSSGHRLAFSYTAAVGFMASCTCGEILVLD